MIDDHQSNTAGFIPTCRGLVPAKKELRMNAENDFTIIHGSEFGLACNLKCGPKLKPYETIHFENRRNRSEEYDSSNELCITLKRNPKILPGRDACVLSTDEIESLYHFVWMNLAIIQKYVDGYTTGKGFLRELRIAKGKPQKDEVISWKRLAFVQYDKTLYVRYWPKDFVVEYKTQYGILRYHSGHIPAAFPKIYTEESIVAECKKLWPDFLMAEKYIEKNQEIIGVELETLKNNIEFYKNQSKIDFNEIGINKHIQSWARKNTDEHVREIMECYLKDLCSDFKKELRVISSGTNAT